MNRMIVGFCIVAAAMMPAFARVTGGAQGLSACGLTEASAPAVRGLGLEPLTSLVRRSTLEDVFLRLTGRRLDD